MAAGVTREAARLEKGGKEGSREDGRTRHGFALYFAYTFIFRDEVVKFLLRVGDAADTVFFSDKVAGMGE